MSIWVIVGIVLLVWLFFSRSTGTSVRVIEEDFEARLAPTTSTGPAAKARGKVERERFRSGDEEFELKCSGLELPDGTPVEVVLNGDALGTFDLQQGRGRFEIESASGAAVPVVAVGDEVELRCSGLPVLRGTFHLD